MEIDNIANSTLKVTASSNLDINNDLKKADSSKTLAELLNEEKEKESQKNSERK